MATPTGTVSSTAGVCRPHPCPAKTPYGLALRCRESPIHASLRPGPECFAFPKKPEPLSHKKKNVRRGQPGRFFDIPYPWTSVAFTAAEPAVPGKPYFCSPHSRRAEASLFMDFLSVLSGLNMTERRLSLHLSMGTPESPPAAVIKTGLRAALHREQYGHMPFRASPKKFPGRQDKPKRLSRLHHGAPLHAPYGKLCVKRVFQANLAFFDALRMTRRKNAPIKAILEALQKREKKAAAYCGLPEISCCGCRRGAAERGTC